MYICVLARSPYGHGILKNEPENVTAQNPIFGMDDSEDPADIAMDNPFVSFHSCSVVNATLLYVSNVITIRRRNTNQS